MQFSITKSGLEIFDACRAWGLANLLFASCDGTYSPLISDSGGYFTITSELSSNLDLERSASWQALKADENWQNVFLTYKRQWTSQRDEALKLLEDNVRKIVEVSSTSGLAADLDGDATLPGSLDPASFKGLRGTILSDYREDQTYADPKNWALACLGAVAAQKYKLQRVSGKWQHYVTLPVPAQVLLDDFRDIRELVSKHANLNYAGARVAAAHYAVLLADSVREKAQARAGLQMRFSKLFYFSLFRSGQQLKPSAGGALSITRLINLGLENSARAAAIFATWDYLFRRGSITGSDDLAHAVTDLVMDPSAEAYYRHARIFSRYIFDTNKRVKRDKLYSEEAIMEVMRYVEC